MMNPLHKLSVLLLLAATGCHDSPPGSATVDAAGTDPRDGALPTQCDTWCGIRAPKEANDGFCPVDGITGGALACAAACNAQDTATPAAILQACVQDDPLCFASLGQCIDGAVRLASCTTWCDARAATHANDGFCAPHLQGVPETGCVDVCVRALVDQLPVAKVETCLRDNPLCFVDLAGCTGG